MRPSSNKRALLALVLAALLLFAINPAFAAQTTLAVETDKTAVAPGDTVTATVRLTGNTGMVGAQMALAYDADKFELVDTSTGALLAASMPPVINDTQTGRVLMAWISLDTVSADGALLNVTLRAKEAATLGDSVLALDPDFDNALVDPDLNDLAYAEKPAAVAVKSLSQIENSPTPPPAETPETKQDSVQTGIDAGLTLEYNDLDVSVGSTKDLQVTGGATSGESLLWLSSNENVIKVSEDGTLTAIGGGSAIVSVYSQDMAKMATCVVTVPGERSTQADHAPDEPAPTIDPASISVTPAPDASPAQPADQLAPQGETTQQAAVQTGTDQVLIARDAKQAAPWWLWVGGAVILLLGAVLAVVLVKRKGGKGA